MTISITADDVVPEVFMQDKSATQKKFISNSVMDLEARIAELENELEKKKADAEKGAKLMQMIWGDNFQSDSLH